MSVFSRLTDVINANLHSLLDKSEEPEKMLRLMIDEMEQVQVEMRTQAARVIAEQKQLERHQQALRNQIQEWAAKAELAIQKGREDLARAALTEKLAEMKQCERLEEDKARVAEVLAQLTADSERLAAKLTEAREKQKMLTLREQTAHSRIRARAQVDNQVVRAKLVEMHRQVAVARTYTLEVARRHVAGESVIAEACLAKQTAVDAAVAVTNDAVQLFGGTGYMHGTEVERHYRDARLLPIGGGATEVLTDLAARLLGYST